MGEFDRYPKPGYIVEREVGSDKLRFLCVQECSPLGIPPSFFDIIRRHGKVFAMEVFEDSFGEPFPLDDLSYDDLIQNQEGRFVIWVSPE